jgi:ectoine hydroxylase-related dioxygenase (phytanoyl-CoA dioxygenase family)
VSSGTQERTPQQAPHRPKVDRSRLPELTRDHDQMKRDLAEFGYCLVRDAITQDQVKQARERLLEQAEMECRLGVAFIGDGQHHHRQFVSEADGTEPWQAVRSLLDKGQIFRELVVHKETLGLIEHLLGREYILFVMNGIIMRQGCKMQATHTDQMMFPFPTPVPLMANVFFMISDFDEARGGTRLVPGSHLWDHIPVFTPVFDENGRMVEIKRDEDVDWVSPDLPAGSAFVFDGRLWHGGGANTSGEQRLAVSSAYCLPSVRPQDQHCMSISDEVLAEMTDQVKLLCGFGGGTFGRIDPALGRGNIGPIVWPYIGELHRDGPVPEHLRKDG